MLKVQWQALCAALVIAVAVLPIDVMADMTVEGRVVVYRTTDGIENVLVTVKDAASLRWIGSGNTDSNGDYQIQTADSPDYLSITYDPPSGTSYTPMGRTLISRASDAMTVDTIGLIDQYNAQIGWDAMRYHQTGMVGYANAGGNNAALKASYNWAADFYPAYFDNLHVQERASLLRKGVILPDTAYFR